MAFTRKWIKGLDIDGEKVDLLIEEHASAMKQIADERDSLKAQVDNLTAENAKLKAQVATLTGQMTDSKDESGNSYKELYTQLLASQQAQAANAAKLTAFRTWAQGKGCNRPELMTALEDLVDLDKIDMEGEAVKENTYLQNVATKYSFAFGTAGTQGQPPFSPPSGAGGTMTKEAFDKLPLAERMKWANEHPAEYAAMK